MNCLQVGQGFCPINVCLLENNFIHDETKGESVGELSNYVKGWACSREKGFLLGSFSYRRKEPSTRLLCKPNRLTSASTVASAFFFLLRSHLSLSPFQDKKKRKKDIIYIIYRYTYIYIYIIFAFLAAIYTLSTSHDTAENSWISRSPESASENNPLRTSPSSRRPLLPYRSGPAAEFVFLASLALLLPCEAGKRSIGGDNPLILLLTAGAPACLLSVTSWKVYLSASCIHLPWPVASLSLTPFAIRSRRREFVRCTEVAC